MSKPQLVDPAEEEAAAGPVVTRRQRWAARRRYRRFLRRIGWYSLETDPILTSTRQAEAITPALVSTHPPIAGPFAGLTTGTGQPNTLDPHELYNANPRRITSPNAVIIGAVGSAKSSWAKLTYLGRKIAVGGQVAAFDRKDQQGRGEYIKAARIFGGTVLAFSRARGCTVNVLDPAISVSSHADAGGEHVVGQDELLHMVATFAHGELVSKERAALRAAHRLALSGARAQARVAVLSDVIEALYRPGAAAAPHPYLSQVGLVDEAEMIRWGLDLANDLQRYVDGDLSGLIDGATGDAAGAPLDLSGNLLVMDTSALTEGSPALALVMSIMTTYLSAVWSKTPRQRVLIIEEGYHTEGAAMGMVGEILRSLAKRGRGIGLAVVFVIHHLSDIPKTSPVRALIRESGIWHIFRQDRADDAEDVLELLNWPSHIKDELMSLEQGVHIQQIGTEPPVEVVGYRSALEEWMTNTDEAMEGRDVEEAAPFTDEFDQEALQEALDESGDIEDVEQLQGGAA